MIDQENIEQRRRCPLGGGRADCPCDGNCWYADAVVKNDERDWIWIAGIAAACLLGAAALGIWALVVA